MRDEPTDPTEPSDGTTAGAAVERFFDAAGSAFDDYDEGYADADATVARLRTHVDELAATVDERDGDAA